ncbi:diacylglycerol kinase [Mammaliicoccus sciuri]|uniref:diacylglycerol kinase n=1 Tax=Mammaliicoccus sciuri TaxID=1296 RepID=UPI00195C0949|nr:diacylglycerol kinase family protein [Mammaliicoccus sciuri]
MNKFLNRFKFPLAGLVTILKKDKNFLLHLIFAVLVLIVSLILNLNTFEWLWILFAIFSVLIVEVLNTSIEYVVDMFTDEYNLLAKHAKDTAALAVLLTSIMAAIIGIMIFLPKII